MSLEATTNGTATEHHRSASARADNRTSANYLTTGTEASAAKAAINCHDPNAARANARRSTRTTHADHYGPTVHARERGRGRDQRCQQRKRADRISDFGLHNLLLL